jgi:hypothetical protein
MVAVPIVIAAVCFGVGIFAASRWLPELAPDEVGGLAFFAVCGLLGIVLALVGIHIYLIVRVGDESLSGGKGVLVAGELGAALRDVGTVFGLACAVFLLAPRLAGAVRHTAPMPAEPATGDDPADT